MPHRTVGRVIILLDFYTLALQKCNKVFLGALCKSVLCKNVKQFCLCFQDDQILRLDRFIYIAIFQLAGSSVLRCHLNKLVCDCSCDQRLTGFLIAHHRCLDRVEIAAYLKNKDQGNKYEKPPAIRLSLKAERT